MPCRRIKDVLPLSLLLSPEVTLNKYKVSASLQLWLWELGEITHPGDNQTLCWVYCEYRGHLISALLV